MKCLMPLLLAAAISQSALAADKPTQSPYDTNPACRDRNVDSTKADCVITDTGTPRHTYPPRKIANPIAPVAPPALAAPAYLRKGS